MHWHIVRRQIREFQAIDRKCEFGCKIEAGDLQYGTGVGARVKTPIGPLGVDLGFPLDAPPGDPIWEVHLSLGAPF